MYLKKPVIILICCIVVCMTACENFDDNLILSPWSQYWQAPLEYDDSGAARTINVAAVGFNVDLSPEINRSKIIAFIDRIKAENPDVRLILFPETTLGYYYRSSDPFGYQQSVAETIPGKTTNILSQKAIEHQIFISLGMTEKKAEDLYNSQVLIGPDGSVLSVHHKNYFIPWDKENGFTAGDGITLNIIDGITVATVICHDIEGLDINKKIQNSGAELVLVPLASKNKIPLYIDKPLDLQHVNTWFLLANRVGNEDGIRYNGSLWLSSPGGEKKVLMSGEENYIYGTVKCL